MKHSKRLLALLLTLLLTASLFAGCQGSTGNDTTPAPAADGETEAPADGGDDTPAPAPAADGDKVIRVAWWGNQVRNENTVNALNVYSEQNPGVSFETEFSDWDGYWDKMATQAAANSLPDIIQQDYKYYVQYQSKGQLAGMNEFIDAGILDISECAQTIIDAGRIDGELYALCIGINAPAMIYDMEAVAEAGLEFKNGMTREEFFDAADQIYEATGKKWDWGYHDSENMIEYYVRGLGKVLFLEGKLGIDGPEEIEGFFEIFTDGLDRGSHFSAEECNEAVGVGIEQDPLSMGKAIMSLSYSNQLIAFSNGAGKTLGMVTWPVGESDVQPAMYLKPGQFFSIANSSSEKEEAAKILDFITNSVEANEQLKAERGVPINSKVADAIKPLMSEGDVQVFDYVNEVEQYCSNINPPSPDGISEVLNLCNDMMEQVVYRQMTPAEAAEKFYNDANSILAAAVAE